MAAAQHLGRLHRPVEGGGTEGEHYQELASRGDPRAIALLTGPDIPHALSDLWEMFLKLNGMREYGSFGARRFSPVFLSAASALFGWNLAPVEVDDLVHLDATYLGASYVPPRRKP